MSHPEIVDREFEKQLVALIPHLRAFGHSLTRSPAEGDDLAQEALAKAWNARATYVMGTNMKAWTFMILRNLFFSDRRKSWRVVGVEDGEIENFGSINPNAASRLELDEVRRALNQLTDEQREALILIGAAGISYEDASEVLGVAIGTVKSRVSRARDQLEVLLDQGQLFDDRIDPALAMDVIMADSRVIQARRIER